MKKSKPYLLVLRGVLRDRRGRFLLMRRTALSRSWPGRWEFPGGKVDRGEELTHALKREFLEETGLDIAPAAFIAAFTWEREHDRILYLVFHVRASGRKVIISPEHDEFGWFMAGELKKLDVSPSLKQVVDALCA